MIRLEAGSSVPPYEQVRSQVVDLVAAGGLRPGDFPGGPEGIWIGRVSGLEGVALPPDLAPYACRNNRLAEMALATDGFFERASKASQRAWSRWLPACPRVRASAAAWSQRRRSGRLAGL